MLKGHFSLVHERFAAPEQTMETNITVGEWKTQLDDLLKVCLFNCIHVFVQTFRATILITRVEELRVLIERMEPKT